MAEDKSLDALDELQKDYARTFSTDSGKKVFEDLEKRCFSKVTTFDENGLKLAFQEGKRAVLLHIASMCNLDIRRLRELPPQIKGEE